jgi:integrase
VEVGPFPFTKDTISQAFRRARRRTGIHKGEFHALRDTFARNFLTRYGGDIYQLAKILGHGSVQTTEKYYAHLVPADLKAPMDAADPVRFLSDSRGAGEKQKSRGPRK